MSDYDPPTMDVISMRCFLTVAELGLLLECVRWAVIGQRHGKPDGVLLRDLGRLERKLDGHFKLGLREYETWRPPERPPSD